MKDRILGWLIGLATCCWFLLWGAIYSSCGGSGGDMANPTDANGNPLPTSQANDTAIENECVFFQPTDDSAVNMGEATDENVERALQLSRTKEGDVLINNCGGTVTLDQSTSTVTTDTDTNINSNNPES